MAASKQAAEHPIGLWSVVAIGVGGMVGGGIFAVLGLSVQITKGAAPLAFLLGKLHFDREFRNLRAERVGTDWRIKAEPKSDDLPYKAVEFVVAQDGRIAEVKVTSYDQAVLDFHFAQEKMDPPLDGGLFQFHLPPGAQLTEGDQ